MASAVPLPIQSRVWADPFKPLSPQVLAMLVFAFTGLSIAAQVLFPDWGKLTLSPLHLATGLAMLAGLAVSLVNAVVSERGDSSRFYWLVAAIAFSALVVMELLDVGADRLLALATPATVPTLDIYALSFGAAAVLVLALLLVVRVSGAMILALVAVASFSALSAMGEEVEDWPSILHGVSPRFAGLLVQVGMLLCIELFLIAVYRSDRGRTRHSADPAFFSTAGPSRSGLFVGAHARQFFDEGSLVVSARHPPVRVAYYPLLQEFTVFSVMFYLLLTAGRIVSRARNKGLLSQAVDMARLWFRDGIDPPTYYAMELYEPKNLPGVPHILTRFETKNGVLAALNRHRPNPLNANEMSDKGLFAQCCETAGIPYPQRLATVLNGEVTVHVPWTELARDLFSKPQRGMGAKDTLAFSHLGNGRYRDADHAVMDLDGVFAAVGRAAPAGKAMLVQPWLRNHPEIADFAKDSLLAIRVVTCINEQGEPEVTLAMLRLLSKLEPDWHHLPDEEYATAIDIRSGVMGEFLGDNFKTCPVHLTHHPITGNAIAGRVLRNWPALRNAALQAHRTFMHRMVIGWDIALTPEGPVVLEGNSNFDVMFLQRVHQKPIGLTRLGELLNHQMHVVNADGAVSENI